MSDLLDNTEEATKVVVDWLTKKSKTKTKFYIKDFYKLFHPIVANKQDFQHVEEDMRCFQFLNYSG